MKYKYWYDYLGIVLDYKFDFSNPSLARRIFKLIYLSMAAIIVGFILSFLGSASTSFFCVPINNSFNSKPDIVAVAPNIDSYREPAA